MGYWYDIDGPDCDCGETGCATCDPDFEIDYDPDGEYAEHDGVMP